MCENVNSSCSCDLGLEKGAIKKTIENNIFTIFGNVYQENSIVIRYHGLLTENTDKKNIKICYCFDSDKGDKFIIPLTKCIKCEGDCYCTIIDLKKHSKLFFSFLDDSYAVDQNTDKMFELNILKDPITSIMQRYGFEENTDLPVCQGKNEKIYSIKSILDYIKSFIYKLKKPIF